MSTPVGGRRVIFKATHTPTTLLRPGPGVRGCVAGLLTCLALLSAGASAGDPGAATGPRVLATGRPPGACPRVREGDQLWIVSTRALPNLGPCPPDVEVSRCETVWTPSSMEDLCNAAFDGATVIYVHGNRYNASEALERGMHYYWALCRQSTQPLRLVVWSWPSDQICGTIKDVKAKAARTPTESLYLGWVLQQLEVCRQAHGLQDSPLGLIGYSYGARIIAGALHVAAGGALGGRCACESAVLQPAFRVVFYAPAMDYTWLCPGDCYGRGLTPVSQLMATVNRKDPVLRYFGLLNRGRHDRALGAVGFPSQCRTCPVIQLDVSQAIGKSHDELSYLGNRDVVRRTAAVLLQ